MAGNDYMNLTPGKKYRIKRAKREKGDIPFVGKFIKELNKFYIFKSMLGYRECFLKVDFIIEEYEIVEV